MYKFLTDNRRFLVAVFSYIFLKPFYLQTRANLSVVMCLQITINAGKFLLLQ